MNTRTQISNDVNATKYKARSAATSKWMALLARLGYAIKGVVYLIIGFLAVQLAVGVGGKATDQRGAIQTISALPLGRGGSTLVMGSLPTSVTTRRNPPVSPGL